MKKKAPHSKVVPTCSFSIPHPFPYLSHPHMKGKEIVGEGYGKVDLLPRYASFSSPSVCIRLLVLSSLLPRFGFGLFVVVMKAVVPLSQAGWLAGILLVGDVTYVLYANHQLRCRDTTF